MESEGSLHKELYELYGEPDLVSNLNATDGVVFSNTSILKSDITACSCNLTSASAFSLFLYPLVLNITFYS
jgi:hypothetical protein